MTTNLPYIGGGHIKQKVRQKVHEGAHLPKEITKEDLEDDKYLKPVLDDDAFIICLDDLPDPSPAAAGKAAAPAGDAEDLRTKNSELQAELDKLARQFADYRLAVQQTLDQRWGEDDAPAPGAAAGASSSSGGAAAAKSADGAVEKPKDDSKYYWESYAHNGMFMYFHIYPIPPNDYSHIDYA